MQYNKALFIDINSLAGKSLYVDNAGIFLAEYIVYGFVLLEIYLYFMAKRKNEAVFAFYAAVLGLAINQLIGSFYYHSRPFMDHLGITLHKHIGENSFPSDHTTFMLSIAFSLFLFRETRAYGIVAILIGTVSGFARVFIGVHYPYDIMGGMAVGLVSAIVVYLLKGVLQPMNNFIFVIEKKIFGGKI